MLDRTKAPAAGEIDHVDLQEAIPVHLPNGIPLYHISSGKLPVIRMEVIFTSGAYHEKKNGQSFFAAKMIAEGGAGLSSRAIANKFDYFGSYLEIKPGLDRVSFVVYTLSKHLKQVATLLRDLIVDPSYPEQELAAQKRIKKQSIRINKEKTSVLASYEIKRSIFGKVHPYGTSLELEDVDQISTEDLQDYRQQSLCNDPLIVLSGGVQDEDIKVVMDCFSAFEISSMSNGTLYEISRGGANVLLEKASSVQSSIKLAREAIPKIHEDYAALLVLNEVFGGYFGSRLMKNIREEKGFTYGIYSSVINLDHASMMLVSTDVNRENTQATVDEIVKEMNLLRNQAISEEELLTVKNYMLGSFQSSINSPFSLADKFKSVYFHGLGYGFYDHYIDTIKHITSEELMTMADKYLVPESYSQVVAGGY